MAINNARMQQLRGAYGTFDKTKALPGELQVVVSNDPSVPSGKTVYIAFSAGDVRRLVSIEDIEALIASGQFKGEKGDKGDRGQDGTVSFDNLTPAQKESLKGDTGNAYFCSFAIDDTGNLIMYYDPDINMYDFQINDSDELIFTLHGGD